MADKLFKCRECGLFKPATEFYYKQHNVTGIDSRCKKCVSAANAIRYRTRYHNDAEFRATEKVRFALKDAGRTWTRRAPPEKSREKTRLRRSRKRNAEGSFTDAQFQALCAHYDNLCLCCGEKFDGLAADHIQPLSMGGPNSIDNIQPLCRSCNSKKGAKTIDYRRDVLWTDWT